MQPREFKKRPDDTPQEVQNGRVKTHKGYNCANSEATHKLKVTMKTGFWLQCAYISHTFSYIHPKGDLMPPHKCPLKL